MAKLRKWTAYRKIERPYTRWSKVRAKAFVKSRPGKKVIKYDMGDLVGGQKQFTLVLRVISKDAAQIRTNAIEAARTAALKRLEKKLGRVGFYFKILAVPHHMIRENPLAAGAGADRLSTGMKHSFGKIIGTASRAEVGKVLFELYLPYTEEAFGRELLSVAVKKLPVRVTIQGEKRIAQKLTEEEKARLKEMDAIGRAEAKAEAEAAEKEKEAAVAAKASAEKKPEAKKE